MDEDIGHERLTVLKAEIECPCGDAHKIKEAAWPAFAEDVARFVARHTRCLSTNSLPFGERA